MSRGKPGTTKSASGVEYSYTNHSNVVGSLNNIEYIRVLTIMTPHALQKPVEKRGGGTENRRLPKSKKSFFGKRRTQTAVWGVIVSILIYILLLLRREGELCSLHRVESFLFLSVSVSLRYRFLCWLSLYCLSLCYVTLLCHSAMSLSAMALCYCSLICLALLCVSLCWLSPTSAE